jgi:predicted nucleotidyltransferase
MNPLIPEAAAITKELGDVTFIGAVAILLHIGRGRESQDLDFAILIPLSKEELEQKGYFTRIENGKEVTRTPRQYKIDIYSKKPIKGISIEEIVETGISKEINNQVVRYANLEVLIVLKYRAARTQDIEDLQLLAQRKFPEIRWDVIQRLTSDTEYPDLKNTITAFRNIY